MKRTSGNSGCQTPKKQKYLFDVITHGSLTLSNPSIVSDKVTQCTGDTQLNSQKTTLKINPNALMPYGWSY